MKIVHVLPALTKGGAERVVVELANHFVQAGHQVTVITAFPVDSGLIRDDLQKDVRVCYVSKTFSSRFGRYLCLLPWLWRHRSWLAGQEILHCHLTYGAIFGTALSILRRISCSNFPIIVETYHAVGMPIPLLYRWFHARLASRRDALVLMAQDEYWQKFLARYPDLLSKCIPNGIAFSAPTSFDLAQRKSYRKELSIPDNCRFVIGTVGRLVPARIPWVYLPIFAEISRILGPDVHFVIAGSGPELNHLRALVTELKLDGFVHLPGLVLDPKPIMLSLDLYITLNVGEATGVAAMEAAMLGVPVLAVQLKAGYRPNDSDWIWSSPNPLDISLQAVKLLSSPADMMALIQRQSCHVRTQHTVEAMASAYSQLYQCALDRKELG